MWSRGVQVCEGVWLSCQVQLEEGEGHRDGGISQYSSKVRQDMTVCVCVRACVCVHVCMCACVCVCVCACG